MWNIYILQCADGSYYAGISENLFKRVEEHKRGKGVRVSLGHYEKK